MTFQVDLTVAKEAAKVAEDALITEIAAGNHGTVSAEDQGTICLEHYKQKLSNIRKEKETTNVSVNGIELSTKAEDRREMQHYITETIINGLVSVHWRLPNDTFHTYTVQEFKPVYKTLVAYVNACYLRHKELQAALEAASDPATVDLTVGWPTTTYTV